MALIGFTLVSDLQENQDVLRGTCATFKVNDSQDFVDKLSYYLNNTGNIEKEWNNTYNMVKKHLSWDRIADQYIELMGG